MSKVDVSLSVVSHGQAALVTSLLEDVKAHCAQMSIELILTLNQDETLPFDLDTFSFAIIVLRNARPMGFGANHNQAFAHACGKYFVVINPDIRFQSNPLPALLQCVQNQGVGVVVPLVLGADGQLEDSVRKFPGPLKILCKLFGGCKGSDYQIGEALVSPDWAGGMFMLFPRTVFEKLGGFDQAYFLYYEDVDICARLRLQGMGVVACPQARVVHDAQRSSHRNLKYLRWHLVSMMRFFCSPAYWRLKIQKLGKMGRGIC